MGHVPQCPIADDATDNWNAPEKTNLQFYYVEFDNRRPWTLSRLLYLQRFTFASVKQFISKTKRRLHHVN